MTHSTLISAGLFGAWLAHDLEELVTYPENSRRLAARAPRWLPIPDDIRREGISRRQLRPAIGLMGLLMGSAAVDGVRSGGRGWLFQTVLGGFGVHGLGHLATTVAARGYTVGVLTAPTIVIPYWLWARRALTREGVVLRPMQVASMAAIPPLIIGGHVLARRLVGITSTARGSK